MDNRETITSVSLKQWNEGNQKGLEGLLERHLPWIQNHMQKRLGPFLRSKEETCDYIQNTMVEFLQYGPSIEITSDDHFRALIVQISENAIRGRHAWFNAQRRKVARERPLPSDTVLCLDPPQAAAVERPSQAVDRHEKEAWIRLGLELLEPKDREVLVLRQWEGLSFNEISEQLNLNKDAVWARHKRAVHRLSQKVGELRRGRINAVLESSPT